MRKLGSSVQWSKWVALLASGACAMQVPGCTEVFTGITALATTVSAGGVIFLITRVLE